MFKAVFKEAWISFEYLIVNHTHTMTKSTTCPLRIHLFHERMNTFSPFLSHNVVS